MGVWVAMLGQAGVCVFLLVADLRHRRHKGRGQRGLCTYCGYDLRASPGRCPECGAVARRVPPAGDSGVDIE